MVCSGVVPKSGLSSSLSRVSQIQHGCWQEQGTFQRRQEGPEKEDVSYFSFIKLSKSRRFVWCATLTSGWRMSSISRDVNPATCPHHLYTVPIEKWFDCAFFLNDSIDPFTRKDWYDVKAPSMFAVRQIGKTLVNRTQGTRKSNVIQF